MSKLSNDDAVSLLRSSVLTRFMELNPLSALLTGKVRAIWENLHSTGYMVLSESFEDEDFKICVAVLSLNSLSRINDVKLCQSCLQ